MLKWVEGWRWPITADSFKGGAMDGAGGNQFISDGNGPLNVSTKWEIGMGWKRSVGRKKNHPLPTVILKIFLGSPAARSHFPPVKVENVTVRSLTDTSVCFCYRADDDHSPEDHTELTHTHTENKTWQWPDQIVFAQKAPWSWKETQGL